jgi:DNA-binding CsgD family transcriptional regulator
VILQIIQTDPGVRGDTSGGGGKPALLETGATVRVPLFVQEKELIKLVVAGKTSKEISSLLNISKNTVDTHRKNIHKKLELSNSGSLIKFANENNLFS